MKDRPVSTAISEDRESFISLPETPVLVDEKVYSEEEFIGEFLREENNSPAEVRSPRLYRSMQVE